MVNKDLKRIGLTTLVLMGVILSGYIPEKPMYFCEDRPELKLLDCYNLTQYYGLPNGKCWAETERRTCRSGWLETYNDYVFDEVDLNENLSYDPNAKQVICKPGKNNCEEFN